MRYEIAYVSQSGNTEKLAYGIFDNLHDNNAIVTDLSHEKITGKAEVYLLGFGVNKGTIPLSLMDTLDELSRKKVIFFVTGGIEPSEDYQYTVEKKLLPFIPDDCDYRGLFMCYGKWNENVLQRAQNILAQDSDNQMAKKVLEESRKAANHPNESDFTNAVKFIRKALSE